MSRYNDEGILDDIKKNAGIILVVAVALGLMFIVPGTVDPDSDSWLDTLPSIGIVMLLGVTLYIWWDKYSK